MAPERKTAGWKTRSLNETRDASFPACAIHFQGANSIQCVRFDYHKLGLIVPLESFRAHATPPSPSLQQVLLRAGSGL